MDSINAPDIMTALRCVSGLYYLQLPLNQAAKSCGLLHEKYDVMPFDSTKITDNDGKVETHKGRVGTTPYFRFVEDSSCIEQCWGGRRHAFTAAFFATNTSISTAISEASPNPGGHSDAIVFERPHRCTFLCLSPQILRVRHAALGYLAQITKVFAMDFQHTFHVTAPIEHPEMTKGKIHDAFLAKQGELWYIIKTSSCQPGLCVGILDALKPLCCNTVRFDIFAACDTTFSTPIGAIYKRTSAFFMFKEDLIGDTFAIEFPKNSNEVQRASLLGALTLIDYTVFSYPLARAPWARLPAA